MDETVKKYVLDASVGLKWLFKEENDMKQALDLKSDFIEEKIDLMIPTHFFTEICNSLGRKIPNEASSFYSKIKMYGMTEFYIDFGIAKIAFQLMQQYAKISFYDAVYHALAISEGGTFVTADENYYKTASSTGNIMLLSDYC